MMGGPPEFLRSCMGKTSTEKRDVPGAVVLAQAIAAFGIAELLRITSVRNGKRSTVELQRTNIDKRTSEDPIPWRPWREKFRQSSGNGH